MALQLSIAVRNARLDALETAVGASPRLRLLTGAPPLTCAAAQVGTLLCEIALPADWLAVSSGGIKDKNDTWSGSGLAAGNIGHFRLVDNVGTTCHLQGTATVTGAGGDMTVDNVSVALGQAVAINTFILTDANA